jgi:hypothetical protein
MLTKYYIIEFTNPESSTDDPEQLVEEEKLNKLLLKDPATDDDIKDAFSDLKLQTHRTVKALLRWRLQMREKYLEKEKKPAPGNLSQQK